MRRLYSLFTFCGILSAGSIYGQATLPDFTLKNTNGKVSIFWVDDYKSPVKVISVQRSYDSTKNFVSIASIIDPQKPVNGFTDSTPPYNKMYYRLFIGFDSGVYLISSSKRPEVNAAVDYSRLILEINTLYKKNTQLQEEKIKLQNQLTEAHAAKNKKPDPAKTAKTSKVTAKTEPPVVSEEIVSQAITFPSKRIYTDKENNVVTRLVDVKSNKYVIRFLTEDFKLLFEIKNPPDDYFILEKVNFIHSGWYQFEIYKNENLLEENKFYIAGDEKKTKKP